MELKLTKGLLIITSEPVQGAHQKQSPESAEAALTERRFPPFGKPLVDNGLPGREARGKGSSSSAANRLGTG